MKEYNKNILSQIDEKETMIAQVASQSDRLEETMELMRKAKEETNINVKKMEDHRKEVQELRDKMKLGEDNLKKQIEVTISYSL